MAAVPSGGREKKLSAPDRTAGLSYIISTHYITLTVPLIMGLEQNISAVIAIVLFINPSKTEKERNYFSMPCSPIAERTWLKSNALKEIFKTLCPFFLIRTTRGRRWEWRIGGIIFAVKAKSTWRKTCPSTTLSNKSLT